MPSFPVVFLPGNFVRPQGGDASPVKRLTFVELKALRDAIGGGDLLARTPDPQARRYEFKQVLLEGLERYEQNFPLNDIPALAQFKALVEGLLYGYVRLRVYDLRAFNFAVPNRLRYIGVLLNRQGSVVGGTDPDTLFFSASNILSQDFTELERVNADTRHNDNGVNGRELLRGFKERIVAAGLWRPDHMLWMRLLDLLFLTSGAREPVDFSALLSGWKQVGPITLRVSVASDEENYRTFYFPVYEEDYRRKALQSLSGKFTPVENALELTVNNSPAGRVLMPKSTAGDQDLTLMGAGNVEPQDLPERVRVRINYTHLRPHIQQIVTRIPHRSLAAQDIMQDSPFSYSDVLRIPTQYDGFIALEGFRSSSNGNFGERFIERMRGRSVVKPPILPEGYTPPCLVNSGRDCYFVDGGEKGTFFYVESYLGENIDELTLLGYALWMLFDKRASLINDGTAVVVDGRALVNFNGTRFEVSSNVQCSWPAFRDKAATLQRLVGVNSREGIEPLFCAAVTQWLRRGFEESIEPQPSKPLPIRFGPYDWHTDDL